MRMWMVDPRLMCRSHLLGEHKELHMLVGSVRIGRSLRGHIERGQFELASLPARHAALAAEIERRNWNHMSPLLESVADRYLWAACCAKQPDGGGRVNAAKSLELLRSRCAECSELEDA